MIRSESRFASSRKVKCHSDDHNFSHVEYKDESKSPPGLPPHTKNEWRVGAKVSPQLLKPPTNSSPTKTDRTKTTESSYSSNSTDDVPFNSDSDSSFFYEHASSCSSDTSYVCLDGNTVEATHDTSPSQVMTPEAMIKVLASVNHDSNDTRSPGFFTKDKAAPPLMIEELTDLLCHINTHEAAKVEIQWDAIYNVVHQQVDEDDAEFPIDQLEFPDDDSTTSSLSMGSCRPPKSLSDSLALNVISDDR